MSENTYTNLKEMLDITGKQYGSCIAYTIKTPSGYMNLTHRQVRDRINALGTALLSLGLSGKRIGLIGENRYEWEIAYLAIVCGVGTIVPLDKSLPAGELEALIERSGIEAIVYSSNYEEALIPIQYSQNNCLKHLISMDYPSHREGIYSILELIEEGKAQILAGNRTFLEAKIEAEKMSIMLFTSGTTSKSKVVALSHKNICSNLIDLGNILDISSADTFLSILPLHHVFECTVGFLFALSQGARTVFCDGIRHVVENLKEYQITVMACVPGIYERIFGMIRRSLEKQGKLEEILAKEEIYRKASMEERKQAFPEIHQMLGGKVRLFISGAASLDTKIEEKYRLLGLNLVQGYGLTETSPVIAIGTKKNNRIGTVGKPLPSVSIRLENQNAEGIGELFVKGPNIALGYYGEEEKNKESFCNGWFATGDLAKIDEDGFLSICGRKKSVIVLKNGKNIFPEEMENLVNKIEGVEESFIFGKQLSEDKENIKIFVKIVYDKEVMQNAYKAETEEEIRQAFLEKIKEINRQMPKYKAIRGIFLSTKPLKKTTTNKLKRQENLDEINKQMATVSR